MSNDHLNLCTKFNLKIAITCKPFEIRIFRWNFCLLVGRNPWVPRPNRSFKNFYSTSWHRKVAITPCGGNRKKLLLRPKNQRVFRLRLNPPEAGRGVKTAPPGAARNFFLKINNFCKAKIGPFLPKFGLFRDLKFRNISPCETHKKHTFMKFQ